MNSCNCIGAAEWCKHTAVVKIESRVKLAQPKRFGRAACHSCDSVEHWLSGCVIEIAQTASGRSFEGVWQHERAPVEPS
jgi:hypothetical protein